MKKSLPPGPPMAVASGWFAAFVSCSCTAGKPGTASNAPTHHATPPQGAATSLASSTSRSSRAKLWSNCPRCAAHSLPMGHSGAPCTGLPASPVAAVGGLPAWAQSVKWQLQHHEPDHYLNWHAVASLPRHRLVAVSNGCSRLLLAAAASSTYKVRLGVEHAAGVCVSNLAPCVPTQEIVPSVHQVDGVQETQW